MFKTPSANRFSLNKGDKWYPCTLCGNRVLFVVLNFDSGSVAPTLGETVTGATSGNTGVVDRIHLYSGSYANGDAVGDVLLISPTGYDIGAMTCFEDNENVNGSTSGANMFTVKDGGWLNVTGRLYQESQTVEHQGKRYCIPCYRYHVVKKQREDSVYDIDEGDREVGL